MPRTHKPQRLPRAPTTQSCIVDETDLTDAQWEIVRPLLPLAPRGGRPGTTNIREVVNAILYVLRTGCAWDLLPCDFPPRGLCTSLQTMAAQRDDREDSACLAADGGGRIRTRFRAVHSQPAPLCWARVSRSDSWPQVSGFFGDLRSAGPTRAENRAEQEHKLIVNHSRQK